MPLNISQVEHIAKLARLGLTEEEKKMYTKQLSSILEYMELLNEVDTEKVDPTYQVTGLKNVYRQDKIQDWDEEEMKMALENFPESEEDLLKVKRILG